ncbi:aldehyde dehydrogenase family protein [Dactylosporangium sp. NPDC051485]|uniref:aldehyde dehydrogenase family protein n=1 Tax=Dactylosporangium sp. NPDC051485 TaxID=3154846 RepID=UPI003430BB0A
MPEDLQLLIDGEWRDGSGPLLRSVNPAHPHETVAEGATATGAEVERAVTAAAAAADGWRRTPHHDRGAILARAAVALRTEADAFGVELSREEGKLAAEGIGEVRRAAQILDFFAAEANREAGELYASPRAGESIVVSRHPVGVVGVVTPFNFPIAIPAWKIAPALSYGNTVVWKPASVVPLLAQRLARALTDAGLPDGVLNLVVGAGSLGQAIVEHPLVDAVTFTGSTTVGRSLIAACGAVAKPIQAELGGKNAAIVLADADLPAAIDDVVAGAFRASGQRCTATSRLIVQADVADQVMEGIRARIESMVLGDPTTAGTDVGPVITGDARDSIAAAVRAAGSGTRLLTAGDLLPDIDAGHYVRPTLVEVSDTRDPLWTDEIFGPVLAVTRVPDADTALRLANDSPFGLSCALFTSDLAVTLHAMAELRVGVLHINSETGGADPHVPFGGTKASAFGPKEQGRAARDFFTSMRTVYLQGRR